MAEEPLRIFDPCRNFQLQGFTGRGATTTLHDASATGVSISGIFQGAEDFAVLGLYNAYDYFNHLRLKHVPRTDLSGLTLAFDIEYDHALDGAMRLDAAKYPSVSWDSITFECGVGGAANIYEVRLLDHAAVLSGTETPASVGLNIMGTGPVWGTDTLHLYFRDTRYTVSNADCRVEGVLEDELTGSAGMQWVHVTDFTGDIARAQEVIFERTGANEERCHVLDSRLGSGSVEIAVQPTLSHPAGCFVVTEPYPFDLARKFVEIINTAGEDVAGRYGPDQTGVIEASLDVASRAVVRDENAVETIYMRLHVPECKL
jgi:hypothetical protein